MVKINFSFCDKRILLNKIKFFLLFLLIKLVVLCIMCKFVNYSNSKQ